MKHLLKKLALVALFVVLPFCVKAVDLKDGDKIAVLSGQSFEIWSWSPSGYTHLLTSELEKSGVKNPITICFEGQKTEQMLARVDIDVIAKKPVCVLIIPGTGDYNAFAQKTVDAAFTQNLAGVIEKLQAANIKTVLATSYAVNSKPSEARNLNVAEHNEAIRALAQAHNVPLIDFVKVVDNENKPVPFDGSLAAKSAVNQMFAGEVLRTLGYSDQEVAAFRQAWLDIPGAIQFPPSVSVNTYEKLKTAAKASGKEVGVYIAEVLHNSVQ